MKKIIIIAWVVLTSMSVFAENIVLTAIQPLYTITSELTKGTKIKTTSVFDAYTSMDMSREALFNMDISELAKNADAVVTVQRLWTDDMLFDRVRNQNIRIIEIDASHSFDPNVSPLFFIYDEDNTAIIYTWLSMKNLVRMASLITGDLSKIYPQEQQAFEANLEQFTQKVLQLEHRGNKLFLDAEHSEVISLTRNLDYFLTDFNIYAEYVNPEQVNVDSVKNIMDQTGLKIFVSDRYLKRNIIKEIKKQGGKFVVLNTLNIPIANDDEQMDKNGLFIGLEENIETLAEALE